MTAATSQPPSVATPAQVADALRTLPSRVCEDWRDVALAHLLDALGPDAWRAERTDLQRRTREAVADAAALRTQIGTAQAAAAAALRRLEAVRAEGREDGRDRTIRELRERGLSAAADVLEGVEAERADAPAAAGARHPGRRTRGCAPPPS